MPTAARHQLIGPKARSTGTAHKRTLYRKPTRYRKPTPPQRRPAAREARARVGPARRA